MTLFISMILLGNRRIALLGIISGVVYLTQGDSFNLAGINMMPIRFIEIAGLSRVILRKETKTITWNKQDKMFVAFNVVYIIVYVIRCNINPGMLDSISYRFGYLCDALICYVTFRALIKDKDQYITFISDLALLLIPFAGFMLTEAFTGFNYFSYMGGVPSTPVLREGFYRCQASFRHAITAGSVGSTLLPIFFALFLSHGRGVVGIVVALVITVTSHSSGPLMSLVAGIAAWMFWPLRDRMKHVKIGIAISIVLLHAFMTAPVWFIIARISDLIGGDGWHRANLIDQFIRNTGGWILLGMPLELTENWAATKMPWGAVDITNQYVAVGLNGGLISLVLLILYFRTNFAAIGRSIKRSTNSLTPKSDALLYWGMGSVLFSHVVNIMAVSYWDQIYVIWYMVLASLSSVVGSRRESSPKPAVESASPDKRNGKIEAVEHVGPQIASVSVGAIGCLLVLTL